MILDAGSLGLSGSIEAILGFEIVERTAPQEV